MVVIGARGHAKEILDILEHQKKCIGVNFFDNVNNDLPDKLFNIYPIIKSEEEIKNFFQKNSLFLLGLGGTRVRLDLCYKMEKLGGRLTSIISESAIIGNHNVTLEDGLNIMHRVTISSDVSIGRGTLINSGCMIHHDAVVGNFCELSPGVIITGGVKIGSCTSIGSGSIILPKVKIGSNTVVGAGAVVVSDVPDDTTVVGIPARVIMKYNKE